MPPPIQIGGCGRWAGFGSSVRSSDAVEAALVGDVVLRPQRGDQLEQLVHPARRAPRCGMPHAPRTRPPSSPRRRRGSTARPTAGRASPTAWRTATGSRNGQHQHERAELDRARDAGQRGQQRDRLEPGRPIGGRRDQQVVDEHRALEAEVLGAAQVGAHLGEGRRLVARARSSAAAGRSACRPPPA